MSIWPHSGQVVGMSSVDVCEFLYVDLNCHFY